MAKPDWGIKRICQACGARYYDLDNDPIVCPSCGVTFDPEAVLKSRRARVVATDEVKPEGEKPEAEAEEEADLETKDDDIDVDDDSDGVDDATLLDNDDDDDDDLSEDGVVAPIMDEDESD